jgi:glycosyltransferase involved in cell wall biosynthesis
LESSVLAVGTSDEVRATDALIKKLRSYTDDKPILFDARKISDGGIGVYSQNLINTLVQNNIRVTLLGDPDKVNAFAWAAKVQVLPQNVARYSLEEMFLLARYIAFDRYALFHVPHYTLPFGVSIPTIITVHDLIHITHPETIYHRPLAWLWIGSGLMRASLVTTVSMATKKDLLQTFSWIPSLGARLAVTANLLPDWAEQQDIAAAAESKNFFVAVSQAKPHKGILDLIKAFSHANDQARGEFRLIIAGFGATRLRELREYRDLLAARSDIEVIGSLSNAEISQRYRDARFVIIPSRAEGFGLMMIEAHAHGTPVVFRPVPALQELVSTHDICAADFSVTALSAAISRAMKEDVLLSPEQRRQVQNTVLPYNKTVLEDALLSGYLRAMGRVE